MMTKKHKLRR